MSKARLNASLKYWRARKAKALRGIKRNTSAAAMKKWKGVLAHANSVIKRREAELAAKAVPASNGGWHPGATRVPYAGGTFVTGRPKLVWHTTEGYGLPSYAGSAPHFTLDPKTGKLYQHIPITRAARALMHPAGTQETNNARAIQVELIGFAKDTGNWPSSYYDNLAGLARWIEKHAGVPRRSTVTFKQGAARLSGDGFVSYTGHLGHQHVPHNDHWDPGALRIAEVLS